MADSLKWWVEYHREDYEAVETRLQMVRNVLYHGPIDAAARLLERSCVNAVLSIQTTKDRHERAFTAYYAGGRRLDDIANMTVYGYQKADWLKESLATFDFEECVTVIRKSNPRTAMEYLADNFKGLSYTKASFALAMSGVWELMCLDSNAKAVSSVDVPKRIRSADDYMDLCEQVRADVADDVALEKPFLIQWAMYDYAREEHARHLPFFREIFPNL